jgi:hypothetical protein
VQSFRPKGVLSQRAFWLPHIILTCAFFAQKHFYAGPSAKRKHSATGPLSKTKGSVISSVNKTKQH